MVSDHSNLEQGKSELYLVWVSLQKVHHMIVDRIMKLKLNQSAGPYTSSVVFHPALVYKIALTSTNSPSGHGRVSPAPRCEYTVISILQHTQIIAPFHNVCTEKKCSP